MPYARRNALGEIESLHQRPTPEASELVDAHSDEVRRFLGLPGEGRADGYGALDGDFMRVLEDVIDLLAAKGALSIGELPVAAQAKYLARKEYRESRQRGAAAGYMNTGFVTVIDDSAFGQLADLDMPPRERGPRS